MKIIFEKEIERGSGRKSESDLKDDWEYLDGCGGAGEEPRVRKCHRDRCPLVAHDLRHHHNDHHNFES